MWMCVCVWVGGKPILFGSNIPKKSWAVAMFMAIFLIHTHTWNKLANKIGTIYND